MKTLVRYNDYGLVLSRNYLKGSFYITSQYYRLDLNRLIISTYSFKGSRIWGFIRYSKCP